MHPVPDSSPSLQVEKHREVTSAASSRVDASAADMRLLGGGRLRMQRGDGRARFSFREVPRDEVLLHPYLAPAAALAHMWTGNEALHGGAFATSQGAVAVLADKKGGKSTTLALLASAHGVPVLSDDLVIVREGAVLSGPRCIDLRARGSDHDLNLDTTRTVRNPARLRVPLPGVPASTPLIATVVLRWGGRMKLDAPIPADRLRELLPHRMYRHRLAGDPMTILRLAALPMVILTRPRGNSGLRHAASALTDYFA